MSWSNFRSSCYFFFIFLLQFVEIFRELSDFRLFLSKDQVFGVELLPLDIQLFFEFLYLFTPLLFSLVFTCGSELKYVDGIVAFRH
jgi:hypothetical protein